MAMVNQTSFLAATVAKQLKYQCGMSSLKLKYTSMKFKPMYVGMTIQDRKTAKF